MLTSDKIFLIGMPGSGKSTLGKELAEKLKRPFVDLDAEIEQHENLTIPEIFKQQGEDHFRRVESKLLKHFADHDSVFVMATGGGAPCFHNGIDRMLKAGVVIFIDVPLETILERLDTSHRPKFDGKQSVENRLKRLYDERLKVYQRAQITLSGSNVKIDDILNALTI